MVTHMAEIETPVPKDEDQIAVAAIASQFTFLTADLLKKHQGEVLALDVPNQSILYFHKDLEAVRAFMAETHPGLSWTRLTVPTIP